MHLFYTRMRRNSPFFLYFYHGVLLKAVGCSVGIVDSWVLSEGGQLQGEDAQWITIDSKEEKETGWEGSRMHSEADFGGIPFLRKPPFNFLDWVACDSRYPKGWVPSEVRVALYTSVALCCCFEDRPFLHINPFSPYGVSLAPET